MDTPAYARREARLGDFIRAAVVFVLVVVAANWVGWAVGSSVLTKVYRNWPPMTPWTALWLAMLAVSIWMQSGCPSARRERFGRGLAVAVGALAIVVFVEYATGRSVGLDQIWFPDAVRALQSSWPGRPSPMTTASVLMLATAATVTRVELPGIRIVWLVTTAAAVATPFVTVVAYISNAVALVNTGPSTGQSILTALSLLALAAATLALRPDRQPVAWVLARTDRWTLVRLLGVLAGLPIMVGVARWVLLAFGMGEEPAWALAMTVGSFIAGSLTFYWSQREQSLLIDKEVLSRQRAEAEMRYRVIADNAVDIVVHYRGSDVVWVSPSVETGLGWRPEQWVGSDLLSLIHPDDLDVLLTALRIAVPGEPGRERFRIRAATGDYHWVEGHGKPYIDGEGNTDGTIAALRIIDAQVLAEELLEQMAKFDHLTGLTNSAETLVRLQRELECLRDPGPHVGVLVCDVDDFKAVNDTWGHKIGDAVLATVATRIRQCIRAGDTAGRMGGDEFLVLLPGLHDIEEAVQVADKIRLLVAEPIVALGMNVYTTMSIGAAVALPGELPDAIIVRADAAMYRAKHAGKDAVAHT